MHIPQNLKQNRKTVALIVARGGSKRIPKKNIKLFCQRPLIFYSIDYAQMFSIISKIYLSTDCEQIKDTVYKEYKDSVRIIDRPKELATDYTFTHEVLQHASNIICEDFNNEEVNIVLLQPTNPMRFESLFINSFKIYLNSDGNSLLSVSRNYYKLGKITDNYFYPTTYEFGQRSQDMEPLYYENGNIYIIASEIAKLGKIFQLGSTLSYIENYETVDIDTLEDFHEAENKWMEDFTDKHKFQK